MIKMKRSYFCPSPIANNPKTLKHEYNRYKLENQSEAQKLAEIVCKHANINVKPNIIFTGRKNIYYMAFCYFVNEKPTGRITLSKYGETLGTLLHEIAHFEEFEHNKRFNDIELELFEITEKILKDNKIKIKNKK